MDVPNETPAAEDDHGSGHRAGKRIFKIVLTIVVLLLGVVQLVPVERSNPAGGSEISAPAEVKVILERACYDCHSHETAWPWYSYVAPVSWLVAHDVKEGREEMNFSTWDRYDAKTKRKKIGECWEEVEEGEMPLWFYLPLHRHARLSEDDHAVLRQWARNFGAESSESDHDSDSGDDSD